MMKCRIENVELRMYILHFTFAFAALATNAASLCQPIALPSQYVLARYDGRCGWGLRGRGFDETRYNEGDSCIVTGYTCRIPYVGRKIPLTVPIAHGETAQDEAVRSWIAGVAPTSAGYARLCYGEAGREQLARAVLARAAQYAGPAYGTAKDALWCPLNLPCREPGTACAWYRTAEMRGVPRFGNGDAVPVAGMMFAGVAGGQYEAILAASLFAERGLAVRHAAAARCRANDESERSYALPTVGVVIHRASDYAHEMAHYFNFAPADASAEWREFLPAFHALKVHAFSLGIDLGADGGWAEYQSLYGTSAAIAALSESGAVSADGASLLADYLEAEEGDDVREWCESAFVGRIVL